MNGKFRSTDTRWTNKIYKITEVLLKPGFPPMYLTDANDNVARTKNQLLVVKDNVEQPNNKYIRGNPETYIVEKILGKKLENRKTYYLIKWKSYKESESTWEPSEILNRTKALQTLRRKFNENL